MTLPRSDAGEHRPSGLHGLPAFQIRCTFPFGTRRVVECGKRISPGPECRWEKRSERRNDSPTTQEQEGTMVQLSHGPAEDAERDKDGLLHHARAPQCLPAHAEKKPHVECQRPLSQLPNRDQHTQVPGKGKACECHLCGRPFSTCSSLRRQEMSHTGERPFACRVCGNAFIQSSDLQKHSLAHTGEKPFGCRLCGRPSVSPRQHERTHTGKQPDACPLCSGLRRHGRTHTGGKPYGCGRCGKAFSQCSAL